MTSKALLFFSFLAFFCGEAQAEPLKFKANCQSTVRENRVVIESSIANQGTLELGPTKISIYNKSYTEPILELLPEKQKFFRETERGLIFFGTYQNDPGNTVHVILGYEYDLSILDLIELHVQEPEVPAPKGVRFIIHIFAEEEKENSFFDTIICDFET